MNLSDLLNIGSDVDAGGGGGSSIPAAIFQCTGAVTVSGSSAFPTDHVHGAALVDGSSSGAMECVEAGIYFMSFAGTQENGYGNLSVTVDGVAINSFYTRHGNAFSVVAKLDLASGEVVSITNMMGTIRVVAFAITFTKEP